MHRVHHSLKVLVDANAHAIPLAVNVALLDMINRGLRLRRVSRADLGEKRCANLMPRKLENPSIDIRREVNRIGVSHLEIKL